ncbi:hypothetical protein Tco_0192950, partial [Tanacetum coccineum]
DTILGDVDAQTRFETTSKQSNDPPLSKVNIFRSGENNMQLMELMTHYTKLSAFSTKIDNSTASEAITTADVEDSAVPTIPKIVEETLAQTLMEIKAAKPKAKGIVFHDLEKQADRLLAERLQKRRRKHFAALRAQENRNRPPTKTQKRS